jgi:hypothetical protein
MGFLDGLFRTRPKKTSKPNALYQAVYPESVRYALQYKQALMGKTEMRDLLPGNIYEVVYLIAKATAEDRNQQRAYLEDLVKLYVREDYTANELCDLLNKWIDLLPDDVTVSGTKLAQLNRYGADHWLGKFHNLANDIFESRQDANPCLVANTTLFALHHFVQIYNQRKSSRMLILVPDWMADASDPLMGYHIRLGQSPSVGFEIKNECLFGDWECYGHDCPLQHEFCSEVIFVDDTISTGTTAGKLKSFWHTEYGLSVPNDRLYVITDLRSQKYTKGQKSNSQ